MKSIKIGKVKLKNRLFLAPMVDVTDAAYREICRKCGAGMAYTEMLYVDAITHENDSTKRLMKIGKKDKPLGIQITGNSIEEFEKVIPYLKGYDLVDINCGCPSIRITGNEAGSYLLKNPEKIVEMVKLLRKKGFIVTVKIRLGFENNNVMEIAKMIEKAGADALTVHARLAIHSNKIPADWNWIEKVKKELKIPVIGNGDIRTGADAKKMLEICDGVMVARAAIGDPTIFERINYYLKTGKEKEIDYIKNIKLFLEYLKLVKKYDIIDLPRIKYLGSNFLKNFSGASKLRNELHTLKNYDQIYEFLEKFLKHNS
ncbi:MAG: tRNA-dihydrouridine synthase family protein [archaeon]